MFRRTRSISYDPFLQFEPARNAHASLIRGDFEPARQLLAAASGDRSVLMAMMGEDGASTAVYRSWADTARDATSFALLGDRLTAEAWEVRGSGFADTVPDDAWPKFRALLREGQEAIEEGLRLGPVNAEIWAAFIQIGIGRSDSLEAIQRRFEQAHALQPFHSRSVNALLQARCDKWFGSHESMFEFARWVMNYAAPDSPAQVAIVRAHYERWSSIRKSGVSSMHYFSQADVSAELISVTGRFLDASPGGQPAPIDQLSALNWFVYFLGRLHVQPKGMMSECETRIASRPTSWPWLIWKGDHGATYQDYLRKHRS